jgi:putative membrane protein
MGLFAGLARPVNFLIDEMRGRITMKLTALPVVLALAAVSACAPAIAQSPGQARTAHHDTEFLKTANQGSVDEIDLSKIALKKSDSQDVKDFAQKMVDDHTKLLDDMKKFDMEAGVTVPEHSSAGTMAEEAKLELLSGKTFDKAYIKQMVEDHHKTLTAFQAEEKSTGYPAFKDAVQSGAKVVREHLEMANKLATANGVAPAPVPAGGM